jgi:hypothetical protein
LNRETGLVDLKGGFYKWSISAFTGFMLVFVHC